MSLTLTPSARHAAAAASALATRCAAAPPNEPRQLAGVQQHGFLPAPGLDELVVAKQAGDPAAHPVRHDDRAACGQAEEPDHRVPFADGGALGQPGGPRVVGVEHDRAAAQDLLGHQGLDVGQVVEVVDPVAAEMIGGDVGDHGDVGAVVAEAAADDAAAGRLQDRRLGRGVVQHHLGRPRDPRRRPRGSAARRSRPRRWWPSRRAARPGRGCGRSSAPWWSSRWCRSRTRSGSATGHPAGRGGPRSRPATSRGRPALGSRCIRSPGQALSSITAPACWPGGQRDVGQPDVDAAHVEGGRGRRPAAHRRHLGMDQVGHVRAGAARGQVGVPAQRDDLSRPGHRPGMQPLRRQVGQGMVVERDPGQRQRVPLAPARVVVGLPDQGLDVLAAVSGDRRRVQPGRGHHMAVHDEDPVVDARDIFLDDDLGAAGAGPLVRLGGLVRGASPPP